MSNTYFQFKQFRVEQDKCAMKVSTDACIQGAWTPIEPSVKKVLDIGTGTGLLSLMLSQRNNDIVTDAIELEGGAAQQAKENIQASPWGSRINVWQEDARAYQFEKKYDLIIVNPPFFKGSLLGNGDERNKARHDLTLSYEELFGILQKHRSSDGYASVLLPYDMQKQWQALLEKSNWVVFKRLFILPRTNSVPNRVVSLCSSYSKTNEPDEILAIRQNEMYTDPFTALLQPYYLNL